MQAWLIKPLATVTELYLQPFPLRVGGDVCENSNHGLIFLTTSSCAEAIQELPATSHLKRYLVTAEIPRVLGAVCQDRDKD